MQFGGGGMNDPLTLYAGITCEISAVNKMAAGKLPLTFLLFSSSNTGSMQERMV